MVMPMISRKAKIALVAAIFFWASAFVGIRIGLHTYSPEGLALLRYLIASVCMGIIYYYLPVRSRMNLWDACALLAIGAVGIGFYSITLNYGEMTIPSGMASFLISQSPIVTALLAMLFLGERLTFSHMLGFLVSLIGVGLIAIGEGGFHWSMGITYVLLATLSGSFYTIWQKPFLKKYHAIEAATYIIWGGTLFLSFYFSHLQKDLATASFSNTLTVIYLGIFPAAIGYMAWSYVLAEVPASRAGSFFYFMPFVATFLGWLGLNEVPVPISLLGGLLAIVGVCLVNRSYSQVDIAKNAEQDFA